MPNEKQDAISQTGTTEKPLQVESVQYTVPVGNYSSKPELVFTIANMSLAVFLLMVASALFDLTGIPFNYSSDSLMSMLQVTVSIALPAGIIAFISVRRLRALLAKDPALLEDIKFKKKLRRSFLFFLSVSAFLVFVTTFNTIGLFTPERSEDAVQNTFFSLYYGGGAILMTLWLYMYQTKTKR